MEGVIIMIKMIAMDFDWTLVDHTGGKPRINTELVKELNAFIAKGGYAGIVSGRQVWDFKAVFDACKVPWHAPFPNYLIAREAYLWEYNNNYIDISQVNAPILEKNHALMRRLAGYVDETCAMLESHGIVLNNFFVYGDFAVEIHVEDISTADWAMELVRQFVVKKGLQEVNVHRNGIMITMYHKESGKGNALLRAAAHYGIKPDEVLAIGDNYNDISMIAGKHGFVGACVGNADDNIKRMVKENGGYVGNGIACDAVLDIIRQLHEVAMIKK